MLYNLLFLCKFADKIFQPYRSKNFVMNLISCNLWIGESAPSCFFFICRLNIYSH